MHDKIPVVFDIETTGFAHNDEFVCGVFYDGSDYLVSTSLFQLQNDVEKIWDRFEKPLLVTYNGENWRGGFDFSFLRTLIAKEYKDTATWPFKYMPHLDIYPLFDKRFNTTHKIIEEPSVNSLYAKDVKRLAEENNIQYTNMRETIGILKSLDDVDWLDYIQETTKDKTDAQSVYQMIFDPNAEEKYISGSEVPKLYKEGKINPIIKHCRNDVRRTFDLYNIIDKYAPEYEIDRNINQL
ncbi:MAG: ribonuclease H-like domain-containing protein [Halanaerobiales bacterium]